MIHISDNQAREMLVVLGDLRRMAWNIPGNRASNMRRRAKLLNDYLTKKINQKVKTL